MDKASNIEAILYHIVNSKDLESLLNVIEALRSHFCLANIVYHAAFIPESNKPNPLLLLTYEPDWVKIYTERDYFAIDPIVVQGRKGFLPIDWSDINKESNDVKRFFAEANRFDVGRQGVTLPIRGPAGERALFTVTSNVSETEWKIKRYAYMRDFQIIGHFFHNQAIILSGLREANNNPKLSKRESECLQGTIKGMPPKEIAGILNLSTSAVQIYLHSARHKLSCISITEAVAKAVRLELFDGDN